MKTFDKYPTQFRKDINESKKRFKFRYTKKSAKKRPFTSFAAYSHVKRTIEARKQKK